MSLDLHICNKRVAESVENTDEEANSGVSHICSECHPFFTGQQKFANRGGRVEKFKNKYGLKSFFFVKGRRRQKQLRTSSKARSTSRFTAPPCASGNSASLQACDAPVSGVRFAVGAMPRCASALSAECSQLLLSAHLYLQKTGAVPVLRHRAFCIILHTYFFVVMYLYLLHAE